MELKALAVLSPEKSRVYKKNRSALGSVRCLLSRDEV